MRTVRPSKAPNFNVAPREYDAQQQNQLVNQLRLYFTQVDNNSQVVIDKVNSLVVMQWLGDVNV
jgi:23S rRNA G2069 N7-methylase RlmK/C1962 C5-methylase RlmI